MKLVADWLEEEGKDIGSLEEQEDSSEPTAPEEDLKTYQERIDRLELDELMEEFKKFHNLKSTYNSLITYLEITEDKNYYSIPQLDRIDDPKIKETCLKVKRLCENILLKYLNNPPKDPLEKDGKILQSLSQGLYENYSVRFSGIEPKLLRIFTGYALKNVENMPKYQNLEKDLIKLRKKEKNIGSLEKIIAGAGFVSVISSNIAHALNLIDSPLNNSIAQATGIIGFPSIFSLENERNKVSNEYDKKFKEGRTIIKCLMNDYLGEVRRATEAYLGV